MSAGRSRTGRYHMPAWQKRQPGEQPRMTSITARSWTASISGTSGARHRRRAGEAGEDLAATRPAAPAAARAARPNAVRQPDAGHGAELPGARPAGASSAATMRGEAALGLAHEEGVEERRERQRVGRARAAAEHDRVALAALARVQRHSGQVEHLEDVGVGQLVLQREAPERRVAHGLRRSRGSTAARRGRA